MNYHEQLKALGANSNFLKDQWINQNGASTNSITSIVQSTTSSFTSILEHLKTLSVRNNTPQFGALPADWYNQAPMPTQTNQQAAGLDNRANLMQPNLPTTNFQRPFMGIPGAGEKRPNDGLSNNQANMQQNKHQRVSLDGSRNPYIKEESFEAVRAAAHAMTTLSGKVEENSELSTSTRSTNNSTRWNSWSHEEEVFLVVAVLDRFFRRGSLASSGKSANSQGVDCWAEIKNLYDRICAAWANLPENKIKPPLITRSTSALCRHFKIMKVRAVDGDQTGSHSGNFRTYLREWDNRFNLNGKLIPELY